MTRSRQIAVAALALPLLALGWYGRAPAAEAKHPARRHAPAHAESTPRLLGTSHAWSAYFYKSKSGRVCYLVGDPQRTEPAGFKRKAAMAMVTHRPDEHVIDVVSFTEGYPLKDGSDVAIDIDGSKYDLFTKDDSAWARTSDLDKTIVGAMQKGKDAVVKGTPKKGAPTTDTYSLLGFSEALKLIDKACGVKR